MPMSRRLTGILLLLVAVPSSYTIWTHRYAPLLDHPGDMARATLEARWLMDRETSHDYQVRFQILPRLGCDLVLPPLILAFGAHVASQLFLILSLVLFWIGPAFYIIQTGTNRPGSIRASLLLLPFVFASPFCRGFLTWYSGTGLAFLALGHQRWLAKKVKIGISDYLIHSGLVATLFLWHLSAWFMYGVVVLCHLTVGSVERSGVWSLRMQIPCRWRFCLLAAAPSLLLLLLYKLEQGKQFAVDPRLGYGWGSWSDKFHNLSLPFAVYDKKIDLLIGLLWLLAIASWFHIDLRPLRHGAANLMASAVFFSLYWIIPTELGSTGGADWRVLPALFVCVLAVLSALSPRGMLLGSLLLAACIVLRQFEVERAWNRLGGRLQDYSQAFEHLPSGSRVLPVTLFPSWGLEQSDRGFHFWALIERDVFVPDLLTVPGQFPLRKLSDCDGFPLNGRDVTEGQIVEITDSRLLSCYDFLWVLNRSRAKIRVSPAFNPVSIRGDLTVWKRVDELPPSKVQPRPLEPPPDG
jgi:hypothetical protein